MALTPSPTRLTRTSSPTPTARYPRVDGSSSTWPLQTLLAAKQFGADYEWREGFGERFIYVDYESIAGWPDIYPSGTSKAYLNLIQGKTDFILVPRDPSADELSAAQARGVTLEVSAVALDAFVFVVHMQNPVTSLTVEQLRGIYAGQITNWAEVGGKSGLIQPYQGDSKSGTQPLMDKLVMLGASAIDAPDMLAYDQFGPLNLVNQEPLGLGYSGYYYMTVVAPQPLVKLLSIQGIAPTSATVAQRSYPLLSEVYAVVRGGTPADHPAMKLRDWILSEEGQAIVAESGYVPIR